MLNKIKKFLIKFFESSLKTLKYEKDKYTGVKIIQLTNDELSDFYIDNSKYQQELLLNQYLFIKDENGTIIDKYKLTEDGLEQLKYVSLESKQFGKIKPKDSYQAAAMDSLKNNQITMLRGAAGSGKTWLAFGYLFEQLEKGKIDKIIVFCNTVATAHSAKLGFYPGSKDEKLLDSQIGTVLSSKLGDRLAVEKLIDDNMLLLLPLSDIRGFDTTGMHAGVYISEAQNLDIELMKLALQRIGEDSKCIIDGDDETQVDLPAYAGENNGMRRASVVFRGKKIYGEVKLQNIYRSEIARLAQLM